MQVGTGAFGVNQSALFRLQADGLPDPSFPLAIVDDDIGQMVCAKDRLFYCAVWQDGPLGSVGNLKVSRLNHDGSADRAYRTFNVQYGPGPHAFGTLLTDGGFLIASRTGVERYDSDGIRDPDFGARVGLSLSPNGRYAQNYSVTALDNGRLLLTGPFDSIDGIPVAGLARLTPITNASATRLVNLSIRTTAGSGDQTLIAGFVIAGSSGTRSVLARAVGPGLQSLGLNARDVIANPRLTLFHGSSVAASNDDWDPALAARASSLGAFPLVAGSKDAALLVSLAAGAYTAHVASADGGPGLALIELYDADPAPASATAPRLVNLSGRAHVGTGNDVLIAGFVISGTATKRLLIRGIGPGLRAQGVGDTLADPQLEVHRGVDVVAENDDWHQDDAATFTSVGAFALDPGSHDAAVVVDLPSGVYTAVVRGAAGTTGSALVEVYEVP